MQTKTTQAACSIAERPKARARRQAAMASRSPSPKTARNIGHETSSINRTAAAKLPESLMKLTKGSSTRGSTSGAGNAYANSAAVALFAPELHAALERQLGAALGRAVGANLIHDARRNGATLGARLPYLDRAPVRRRARTS